MCVSSIFSLWLFILFALYLPSVDRRRLKSKQNKENISNSSSCQETKPRHFISLYIVFVCHSKDHKLCCSSTPVCVFKTFATFLFSLLPDQGLFGSHSQFLGSEYRLLYFVGDSLASLGYSFCFCCESRPYIDCSLWILGGRECLLEDYGYRR